MIKAWLDKNERRARHTASLRVAAQRAREADVTKAARMRAEAARLSAEADRLTEEAERAFRGGSSAAQFPPLPPSARLIECGAYLYEAAMRGLVPTFHDAARRGYQVHAAALHSALQDALALGELTQDSEGRVSLGLEGSVCEMWDIRKGRSRNSAYLQKSTS